MSLRLLQVTEPAWNEVVALIPDADVYHTATYQAALAGEGAEAFAFVYQERDDLFLHPGLRRQIALMPGTFDVETAYGYGGVVSSSPCSEFLARAWNAWKDHCRTTGVIAEFIRLHPLLDSRDHVGAQAEITLDRPTVVVPLAPTEDDIWNGHEGRHRTAVRRAREAGLDVLIEPLNAAVEAFHAMYTATMSRIAAATSYFFGRDSFSKLARLGDDAEVVWALNDGERLAGSLLIYGKKFCHYHLSAATEAGLRGNATNLVIDAAWRRAKSRGCAALHLGGGRTRAPDDSLLKFKSSVSRHRRMFETAAIVHDARRYCIVKDLWSQSAGRAPSPGRVLAWR